LFLVFSQKFVLSRTAFTVSGVSFSIRQQRGKQQTLWCRRRFFVRRNTSNRNTRRSETTRCPADLVIFLSINFSTTAQHASISAPFRQTLAQINIFTQIASDKCPILHYMLPTKRDSDLMSRVYGLSIQHSVCALIVLKFVFTIFALEFPVNLVTVQFYVFSVILLFLSVCDCFVHVLMFNPAYD